MDGPAGIYPVLWADLLSSGPPFALSLSFAASSSPLSTHGLCVEALDLLWDWIHGEISLPIRSGSLRPWLRVAALPMISAVPTLLVHTSLLTFLDCVGPLGDVSGTVTQCMVMYDLSVCLLLWTLCTWTCCGKKSKNTTPFALISFCPLLPASRSNFQCEGGLWKEGHQLKSRTLSYDRSLLARLWTAFNLHGTA